MFRDLIEYMFGGLERKLCWNVYFLLKSNKKEVLFKDDLSKNRKDRKYNFTYGEQFKMAKLVLVF